MTWYALSNGWIIWLFTELQNCNDVTTLHRLHCHFFKGAFLVLVEAQGSGIEHTGLAGDVDHVEVPVGGAKQLVARVGVDGVEEEACKGDASIQGCEGWHCTRS